jgi:RNA polymerase sigma factor (sigma-70 family)
VDPVSTCWTVIRGAAEGRSADREEFARRYLPVVRDYLRARWRGSGWGNEVDDATQVVFLACFRDGGALEKADPGRGREFRAFLYGIARNVALRVERDRARRAAREGARIPEVVEDDVDGYSTIFDRAWARSIVREAADALRAKLTGEGARRAEILRLRFEEEMPIREIARLWDEDPARIHHEYARARNEFREALVEVVGFHHPGSPETVERECERLLAMLSG